MYNIDKYLRKKKKKRIATFVYLHNGSIVLHSFFHIVVRFEECTLHLFFFFFFSLKHRNIVPVCTVSLRSK